jgi:hypothetical protein
LCVKLFLLHHSALGVPTSSILKSRFAAINIPPPNRCSTSWETKVTSFLRWRPRRRVRWRGGTPTQRSHSFSSHGGWRPMPPHPLKSLKLQDVGGLSHFTTTPDGSGGAGTPATTPAAGGASSTPTTRSVVAEARPHESYRIETLGRRGQGNRRGSLGRLALNLTLLLQAVP